MLVEWLWRASAVALALGLVRFCAIAAAAFIVVREQGCDSLFKLQLFNARLKAMASDEREEWLRARVPRVVRWLTWSK